MNFIEQRIGPSAFASLVDEVGGTDYTVPSNIESERGKQLIIWVGEQSARSLIDYAAGDTVYIGAGHEQTLATRYQEIRRLHQDGLCPRDIARQYVFTARYTERQIWAILEKLTQ